MNNHKLAARYHLGWILTVFALILCPQVSISQVAGQLLSWPIDVGAAQSKSAASLKSYEIRKGQIALAQELLPKPVGAARSQTGVTASKGATDTALLNLFPDTAYELIIDSVKHHTNGTMIISGKLKDHKIGTVVMTIGPDTFLITLQDMNRSRLYRVTGDSHQGSGTVTEIDMKKMPPMIR